MPNINWLNSDGLYVKFGDKEAAIGVAGEVAEAIGNTRIIEMRIPALSALTAGDVIQEQNVVIPKNTRIEWVEVMNTATATSGGAATLSLGLVRSDQSTLIAAAGLISAAPLTDFDTLGETKRYSVGVAGVGTLVGAVTGANTGLITAKFATAAFTAGALTIRIAISNP
jgi:hypothetical protein